jgi:hypothetical protein
MQLLAAALRDYATEHNASERDEIIAALISPFGQSHKKGGGCYKFPILLAA